MKHRIFLMTIVMLAVIVLTLGGNWLVRHFSPSAKREAPTLAAACVGTSIRMLNPQKRTSKILLPFHHTRPAREIPYRTGFPSCR